MAFLDLIIGTLIGICAGLMVNILDDYFSKGE